MPWTSISGRLYTSHLPPYLTCLKAGSPGWSISPLLEGEWPFHIWPLTAPLNLHWSDSPTLCVPSFPPKMFLSRRYLRDYYGLDHTKMHFLRVSIGRNLPGFL